MPDEAAAWTGLALALQGESKAAWSALSQVRCRGPERAFADAGLGWLRVVAGGDDAVMYLRRCLERLPRHPGALFLLGILAERRGQPDEAQQHYAQAAEADPAWPEPWLGLVRAAMAGGDPAKARGFAPRSSGLASHGVLVGLVAALAGDAAAAEEHWRRATKDGRDRTATRGIAALRAAAAWRLGRTGRPEAAAGLWSEALAGQPGRQPPAPARAMGRRLCAPLPRGAAARVLRGRSRSGRRIGLPTRERGPRRRPLGGHVPREGSAAARSGLERACAWRHGRTRHRAPRDDPCSPSTRSPPPKVPLPKHGPALEAAARARQGDAQGCLRQLDSAMEEGPSAAVRAVVGGARALARLALVMDMLRAGELEDAVSAISRVLDHLPEGLERDLALHDLAAVATIAAPDRLDSAARAAGAPPPPRARSPCGRTPCAAGWTSADSAGYWAHLQRRVLELDDPRVSPRDVDGSRATLDAVASAGPAAFARDALVRGHGERARAYVGLVLSAPVTEEARREALALALSPLTSEARQLAEETRTTALQQEPGTLRLASGGPPPENGALLDRMRAAGPHDIPCVADAEDEVALGLVSLFENLHDRAAEYAAAKAALSEAAAVAASQSLKAEISGKLARMEKRT